MSWTASTTAVGHDVYMIVPGEVTVEVDAEVTEGVGRGDVAGAVYQVNVSKAQGCVPNEVTVGGPLLEGHQLGLGWVSV